MTKEFNSTDACEILTGLQKKQGYTKDKLVFAIKTGKHAVDVLQYSRFKFNAKQEEHLINQVDFTDALLLLSLKPNKTTIHGYARKLKKKSVKKLVEFVLKNEFKNDKNQLALALQALTNPSISKKHTLLLVKKIRRFVNAT